MDYSLINWEDSPSTKTPINAENLKHMDEGIAKAHKIEVQLEIYKANSIISTSSGTVFHETDCAAVPPINIKLFGKGKQRQYEGNQLLDVSNLVQYTDSDDWMTIPIDNTDGTTIKYFTCMIPVSDLIEVGKDYLAVLEIKENTLGSEVIAVSTANSDKSQFVTTFTATNPGTYTKIVTAADDFTDCKTATRTVLQAGAGTSGRIVFRLSIIEDTTVTADTFVYEPYVGGEQSPNMRYPQKAEFLGESGSIGSGLGAENYAIPDSDRTKTERGITTKQYKDESKMHVQGVISKASYPIGIMVSGGWEKVSDNARLLPAETTLYAFPSGVIFEIYDWHNNTHYYFSNQVTLETDFYLDNVFVRFPIGYFPNGTIDKTVEYILTDSLQPFTSLTPNGLRGIPLGQTIPDAIKNSPIHMSGVYWDGEQYQIADTENEDGKDVQRILENTFDGSDDGRWKLETTSIGYRYSIALNTPVLISDTTNGATSMNTSSQLGRSGSTWTVPNCYTVNLVDGVYYLYISLNGTETLEEFKTLLAENPMSVYCVLAEPIITESTDQYDVVMNYPNTTIVNDAGAYMEVEYVADTQEYIKQNYVSKEAHQEHENRIAELEKAIVNS